MASEAELIDRIRMLVKASEAKDRYIKQLELQIDRDKDKRRREAAGDPFHPDNRGFDGPQGAE